MKWNVKNYCNDEATWKRWQQTTLDEDGKHADCVAGGHTVKLFTIEQVIKEKHVCIYMNGGNYGYGFTYYTPYLVIGIFRFAGSDAAGAIQKIEASGFRTGNSTSWDVKVYDVTNAQTIAEADPGGTSLDTVETIDMGAVSNVPTGPALFEIQIKRTGGTGNPEVACGCVNFIFDEET
jgi:hypothetical protein